MKKHILTLFFFLAISSYSQNAYFVDLKGKKTFMRDDSVEIIVIDSRISYAEVDKEWEKYIRFKDLDYAMVGPHYLKSFELINKKGKKLSRSAYFVIAETATKKLLTFNYTIVGKYTSTNIYTIIVIDNNNNIIEFLKFSEANTHLDIREKILPTIKNNFSDCSKLIEEIGKYPDNDEKHKNILQFFDKNEYLNCN